MMLFYFPTTILWGKECFNGGKTDTRGSQNWTECSWRELFLQDFSTSKLLAPEFPHTAPRTFSKWPPASTTQQLFNRVHAHAVGTRYNEEDPREETDGSATQGSCGNWKNPALLWNISTINDIQTWIFSSFVVFNVSIKVINRLLWI